MKKFVLALSWICSLAFSTASFAQAVRIKDITTVEGARGNQLYGLGLVVGLNGTGGRSLATLQMAIDMQKKMGVGTTIARQQLLDNVFQSTNISSVMVTTELPPFAREGSRLDVTVSVLDDAASLKGGTLLLTPLKGADGEVYAVAQGTISIGGGPGNQLLQGGASHPTVGRITSGAIVEREELGKVENHGRLRLLLRDPDYSTAQELTAAVNDHFVQAAYTIDAGAIDVRIPRKYLGRTPLFLSEIGQLKIRPDTIARVVINPRTSTVVVGGQVKIAPVAIAHDNLVIQPVQQPTVAPLGPAASLLGLEPPPETGAPLGQRLPPGATPLGDSLNPLDASYTVTDLAKSLNALGATPRDMVAIFEALKEAGALHADLVVK